MGTAAAVVVVLCAVAAAERAMGRSLLCPCGSVHFWVGSVHSPELSQQVADPYSFTHVSHGLALYGFFHLLGRRRGWSLQARLVGTTLLEACWEVLENSPVVIDRYRQTAAAAYAGDSVLNSLSDIAFCLVGFGLASRLPVRATVTLIVAIEVGCAYAIHDNLTLNIVMLVHPFAAVRRWQLAGG